MPEYPFETQDGQVIDLYFPMSEAPEIGSQIEVDGQKLTRLPPQLKVTTGKTYAHVAQSLALWDPHAPHHTPEGKPYFNNKKEVMDYQAKTNGRWKWDL